MRTPDERRQAHPRFERGAIRERVEFWARRLNVRPRRVCVRRMTRKWGSCSTSGVLTLAADLADHEPGFQDFVIAHELLHLRVPNHGKLFKTLLTAHVPDWKRHDVDRRQPVRVSAYGWRSPSPRPSPARGEGVKPFVEDD